MRALLTFFAIGALLLGIKPLLGGAVAPTKPSLRVDVPAQADASAVRHAIERQVLCEHALELGAAYVDLVVRDELLRAMPASQAHETVRARIERALSLGVPRAAPLVCERLAFQARQALRSSLELETPSDETLARYLSDHAARYREPARIEGLQVYISRARHAEQAPRVAARRLAEVRAFAVPEQSLTLAEPSLLPARLQGITPDELDARFGAGFGAALVALPLHVWSEPIDSAFGTHLVRIEARVEDRIPPLSAILARVRDDFLLDARSRAEQQAVAAMCAQYQIDLHRSSP